MCLKTFAFDSTALLFYANATSIGTDNCSRYKNQDAFAFSATLFSFCVKLTPTGADTCSRFVNDDIWVAFFSIFNPCHVTPTYWSR